MKIVAVRLQVLEAPAYGTTTSLKLVPVANLRRTQYTHTRVTTGHPVRQNVVEAVTDEGISGRFGSGNCHRRRNEESIAEGELDVTFVAWKRGWAIR